MLKRIHDIPLLILVLLAAGLAVLFWKLGAGFLADPIMLGETSLGKSVAALAKDSLFVPLKPLMYALIIMSIGSSLAISRGGMGAKFIRVFSFMVVFSVIGAALAVLGYTVFSGTQIFGSPADVLTGLKASVKEVSTFGKIYGVLTSPLMISIYAGIIFGRALKKLGLGQDADKVSDLFMNGFRKFLQYTIPLAVFGSVTIALNKKAEQITTIVDGAEVTRMTLSGIEQLHSLLPLLPIYFVTFFTVWIIMILATSAVLKRSPGFVFRAIFPQAVVAMSSSSSIATLPATKLACDQLGANGDESTPFITIGATINMVGTLMGLTIVSLYAMTAFSGEVVAFGDRIIVALQSLIYSVSAAGVPSASVVLLQEILTSQGVSAEYATYVTALIITIDVLALDRMRTMLNTQSDSMSTVNGLHRYYKSPKILGDT